MNQHPVPQNVTQYQFRLVGDMTLKQFLELAGGLVLAILFYSTNLIFIFKWPLILLSIFLGIALAFFPIEDRPLDQWIINFLNSIYKPTRFIWKKTNKVPTIFTFSAHPVFVTNTITKTIKAPTKISNPKEEVDLSELEGVQIKSLNSLFNNLVTNSPPSAIVEKNESTNIDKPSVVVRKLKPLEDTVNRPILVRATPTESPIYQKPITTPTPTTPNNPTPPSVPTSIIFSQSKNVSTPPKTVSPTPPPPLKSITLPVSPKSPNLVVGVITDKVGKFVESAIVQIIDESGIPARAIKTNALGQFATSTPLSPGTYHIEVEADGHTFPTQQLVINDSIIKPFEISANS